MSHGYSLMYSVVHGNVLGAVIAPKGTEDFPKSQRPLVWRAMVQPLVSEVAEHEEFPREDARKVIRALQRYCVAEGLAFSLDPLDRDEE